MSRFLFSSFFLFGLDEKIERKREREREKKREDLPYCYDDDDDDVFFYTRNIRQERHKTARKCADGLSDFDFISPRYLASCDDYTYLPIERERERL